MQKKWLLASGLLLSTVVLAGCFGSQSTETTTDEFTHASCNDYVELMRCVAAKQGGDAFDVVEQAIASWKSLPENELTQTCDMAMEVAIANAAAYEQLGCAIAGAEVVIEDEIIMEDNIATGDIVEDVTTIDEDMSDAVVMEDEATIEEVTSEVVEKTSAE